MNRCATRDSNLEKWPETPAEAQVIQDELRERVVREDQLGPMKRVAGLDAHYASEGRATWGAAAVLRRPTLELEASALERCRTRFPYIPGFLSFREAPVLLAALDRLPIKPDLLLVDGQGLAHPRRFGLACHVGVLANLPTIGVAKSRLIGTYEEPGEEKGAWSPLVDHGAVVGAVVRTRRLVRPVFVSVGHRVGLDSAIELVLACTKRFRLPEPTRIADSLSRTHPP